MSWGKKRPARSELGKAKLREIKYLVRILCHMSCWGTNVGGLNDVFVFEDVSQWLCPSVADCMLLPRSGRRAETGAICRQANCSKCECDTTLVRICPLNSCADLYLAMFSNSLKRIEVRRCCHLSRALHYLRRQGNGLERALILQICSAVLATEQLRINWTLRAFRWSECSIG